MITTLIVAGLCVWSIAVFFAVSLIRNAHPPERDHNEQPELSHEHSSAAGH
jgi:hypothetical protein